MKLYKYIKASKGQLFKLGRKTERQVKRVVLRSTFSKTARKYLKMEARIAIKRALGVFSQYIIRPRLTLASRVIITLFLLLVVSMQLSNMLSDRRGEIKVRGRAVLVADAAGPIDSSEEISSRVYTKLSPFAYVDPVENGLMSQGYNSYHRAIDIATKLGSPIKPIGTGAVEFAGYSADGKGNIVIVDHGDGLKTLYAHMGKIEVGVGNLVNPDSTLGTVGLTGRTTGAHLHLEVYDGGVAMNPSSVLP